jgi:predicted phage baseplate assembly protein
VSVVLRFGDGTLGALPKVVTLTATGRQGNGPQGNIWANLLTQLVTDLPPAVITMVANPLPATGGTDPEPTEDARVFAPTAYRRMLRAASVADVETLARESPLVTGATAERVGGNTPGFKVGVTLDPRGTAWIVDEHLQRFRIWGTTLTVEESRRAGVDVVLAVYFRRGADASVLRARLAARLAGFFDPSSWRAGQPVHLADVRELLEADPDVTWVNSDPATDPRLTFGRIGAPRSGFPAGRIDIEPWLIATAANDPAQPENGRAGFYLIPDR